MTEHKMSFALTNLRIAVSFYCIVNQYENTTVDIFSLIRLYATVKWLHLIPFPHNISTTFQIKNVHSLFIEHPQIKNPNSI